MNAEPIHLVKYIYGSTSTNSSKTIIPFSELDLSLKENKLLHSTWKGLDSNIFQKLAEDLTLIPADQIDSPEKEYIIILLVKSQNLTKSDFYQSLTKSGLRPLISPKDRDREQEKRYFPIVTVCFTDITSLYTEEREKDDQGERDWNEVIYKTFDIDPRVKFLDSSIWNRFAPISSPHDKTFNFKYTLKELLEDIISYYRLGLYYSIASNTMLEFQMRMFVNSYIAKYSEKGHSSLVTPFKFHSESQMKRKAKLEINFLKKEWNEKSLLTALEWRMLIVDDQAADPISVLESKYGRISTSKKDLIRLPLIQLYEEIGLAEDEIDKKLVVDSIPRSQQHEEQSEEISVLRHTEMLLKEKAYDIIFLDYLLGPKEGSETEREYGFQFLLDLLEDNRKAEPEFKYDYSGRYWIFPISSFPHALPDKLVQLGISPLHEIWHISQGGDPISTPHLYAYNLFRFIKQRISEYFLYPSAFRVFLNKAIIHNGNEEDRSWITTLQRSINGLSEKNKTIDEITFDPKRSSPFIYSIKWFLKIQRKAFFDDLLKIIMKILSEIKKDGQSVSVEKLLEAIKNIHPDYNSTLNIFTNKILSHQSMDFRRAKREIEVVKSKGLQEINLSGYHLIELPPNFADLKRIERIDLSNNKLSSLPDSLIGLSYLTEINLNNNKFKCFPEILLSPEFRFLEKIDLSNNPLDATSVDQARNKLLHPPEIILSSSPEKVKPEKNTKSNKLKYEVAISFAGEDREYVDRFARALKNLGVLTFYDKDKEVELWGKELIEHLTNLYEHQAQYCIIFISLYYKMKFWTNTEFNAALKKAAQQDKVYILPVKLDGTELDGLPKTIGFLNGKKNTPEELAKKVFYKLEN